MQNGAVTQQVLDRIEKRIEQFGTVDKPTLKVIAAPVSPARPMIQPSGIYDLYERKAGVKRVSGGVCVFTEPSDDYPDQSINPYTEFNEYGVVYYSRHLNDLHENRNILFFIDAINNLLEHAKTLYNACDASVNIRVHAALNNVFKEELAADLGMRNPPYQNFKPVCYDSQVCVSTAKTYASTDFDSAEHRKTILEELTMPLLWSFNVPIDNNSYMMKYIRELISENVRN